MDNQSSMFIYVAFIILILAQPTATTTPAMVTLNEGDNLTITCKATGVPAPSVTWSRADGSSLTDSRYVISDISSSMVVNDVYQVTRNLTIMNIIREDAGETYGCIVTNAVNTLQSNVIITVQCKWIIIYMYLYVHKLTCNVTS